MSQRRRKTEIHVKSKKVPKIMLSNSSRGKLKQTRNTMLQQCSKPYTYTCKSCQLQLSNLQNYWKHINELCSVKKQKGKKHAAKTQGKVEVGNILNGHSSLVTRETVEDTVILFKREMIRQKKLLSKVPCNEEDQLPSNFQTCNMCHKTFFSFANLLKHQIYHKLSSSDETRKESQELSESLTSDASIKKTQWIRKKQLNRLPEIPRYMCETCHLPLTNLQNYWKHVNELCPVKKQKGEELATKTEVSDWRRKVKANSALFHGCSSSFTRVPVENSVLLIKREMSIQKKLMSEIPCTGKGQSSSNFVSFTCNICHKIYFSYARLLQHQVYHKLASAPNERPIQA
ncbi:uncharacterized protein LOC143250967 isoform X3 [Tachypleus tridentatus]